MNPVGVLRGVAAGDKTTHESKGDQVLPCCPQCDAQPCFPCRRLAEVEQQLQGSEEAQYIANLCEERRQMRVEFNYRNDLILQILPIELAYRIFAFCLPETPTTADSHNLDDLAQFLNKNAPNQPFQLSLGAVCHAWRHVVWSYPQFWTSIPVLLKHPFIASHIPLIEEWIGRSGQLPLTIRIQFKWYWPKSPEVMNAAQQIFDRLIPILNSVSHRWSCLSICIPIRYIGQLRFQHPLYTNLRALALTTSELRGYQSNPVFDPGVEVSPVLLRISGFRLQNLRIGWSNLTRFAGDSLTLVECIHLLRLAPQLTNCTFANIDAGDTHPETPVVHSRLEALDIEDHAGIFDFITLPSLKNLKCGLSGDTVREVLSQFITRSGCALERATLTGATTDDAKLQEFLQLNPSLEELHLEEIDIDKDFLEHLGATALIPNNNHDFSTVFLPKLQVFSLRTRRYLPWSAIAAMVPLIPPSPHERLAQRPLHNIHFEIETSTSESDSDIKTELSPVRRTHLIDRGSLERLLTIKETGVKLEIEDLDNGHDIIRVSKEYYGIGGVLAEGYWP